MSAAASARRPPRTRKSESAGPGRHRPRGSSGFRPQNPFAAQHPLLEVGHPLDRRRVGQVGRLDADVELAGDAGRVLQLVQVAGPRAMLCGASSRMSETVSIWVPTPQPTTASARPTPRTSPGRSIARDRRRSDGRAVGVPLRAGPVDCRWRASRRRSGEQRPAPLAPQAQGGEAGGEGKQEGDRDADDEQQAEAADHRGRGELEGEEAGGGGEAGGGDRGAAGGGRALRAASAPARARRRPPRRSGLGTGSRSRRRGRSGSAGRRSRPSSGSRRRGRRGRR